MRFQLSLRLGLNITGHGEHGLCYAFSQQEYRERTVRLRQRMAERGMDALLVLNSSNLNYLTGYEGSDYVPQPALVCQDEEDPWLIMRACAVFS